MASSSSYSPCSACKFLRRKCQPECVFAPYFPPDQPQKFIGVHKVFGASNITKLLGDLPPQHREDAVNSLAYEADMRLRDPVYGCVGVISLLQQQLRQLQIDLTFAKSELSRYQAPQTDGGAGEFLHQNQPINFLGDGLAAAKDFQHQFFHTVDQPPQQAAIGGFDESSYLAMTKSVRVGQWSGFQAVGTSGTAADERRTPGEPS